MEKPWGRNPIPSIFGYGGGARTGEVWFEGADDLPLLAKYIFTSETLSIQNHPSDEQAALRALPSGKDECWYVLEAEEGATLGLGLTRAVSRDELRRSAVDGSIVELVDWKPVRAGDFYYVPAGTVHAIGAGISLLEFQQNADVTYRLYDFGRPRELHIDDGVRVADPAPYADSRTRWVDPTRSAILVPGPHFCLALAVAEDPCEALVGRRRWVLPIDGTVSADGVTAGPGECLLVGDSAEIRIDHGRALIGAEGSVAFEFIASVALPQTDQVASRE